MEDRVVRRVVVGVVIIWLVWFFNPSLAMRMMIPWSPENVGQWGDSFGALNALMSTFAFGAVFYTLRLQQRQIIETQRDQHVQRFESSFFEILRIFREAREKFQYRYSKEYIASNQPGAKNAIYSGLEAIRRANFEMLWALREAPIEAISPQYVSGVYDDAILGRFESTTAPYFRLLYTLLFRIKSDDKLNSSEKRRYANLLRSQLTSHEVALAGFNGLNPVSKDLADLITEFRLLKYIRPEFGRDFLDRCYANEAFAYRPD